ncbi:MAG: hypothetical protein QXD55_00550 [Candidatus Aenigmatarchaeota archaeon]
MLHLQQRTKINLIKIIEVLKNYGQMHIRGIAKITGIHPITVSTLINRLDYFFNTEKREVVPGFTAKIVSLKNKDITIKDIEKYLELKKSIKKSS